MLHHNAKPSSLSPPRRNVIRCRLCGGEFLRDGFPFHAKKCAKKFFVDLDPGDPTAWKKCAVLVNNSSTETLPIHRHRGRNSSNGEAAAFSPSAGTRDGCSFSPEVEEHVGEAGGDGAQLPDLLQHRPDLHAGGGLQIDCQGAATATGESNTGIEPLEQCSICGRSFFASRLKKHEDICRRNQERRLHHQNESLPLESSGRRTGAGLHFNKSRNSAGTARPSAQQIKHSQSAGSLRENVDSRPPGGGAPGKDIHQPRPNRDQDRTHTTHTSNNQDHREDAGGGAGVLEQAQLLSLQEERNTHQAEPRQKDHLEQRQHLSASSSSTRSLHLDYYNQLAEPHQVQLPTARRTAFSTTKFGAFSPTAKTSTKSLNFVTRSSASLHAKVDFDGRARPRRSILSSGTKAAQQHAAEWGRNAAAMQEGLGGRGGGNYGSSSMLGGPGGGGGTMKTEKSSWWSGNPVQTCYKTNSFLTQGASFFAESAATARLNQTSRGTIALPARVPNMNKS
ncbi:unnamed protein product [Amoebophrya sp. A120]|nr:unnamed protein product [Amoebophrya sp. A120]|eukprot:GSA120T00000767001.1